MDDNKKFYAVTDIMQVLNIKEAKAYQIIRTLNKELKAKGKITVQGRVSRKYFEERVLV
ncbi:MAG: transcriptional regulator [Eubacteriales bacterium]|nr:transcriptional regulator [Eubacteriales bacterium]